MEHMVELPKGSFDMIFHSCHLFFCVKLRLTALLRGPEDALLFCPVWVQEDLKVCVICQSVKQADVVIKLHQHRIKTSRSAVWMLPF